MSGADWYTVTSVVLLSIGLTVGVWFGVSWGRRIRPRFTYAALDAGGWVYGLIAVYAYALVGTLRSEFGPPASVYQGITRLALMALLDALLVARAIRWWRFGWDYRREHEHEQSERKHHE
jgi:hypothetical protein